SCRQRSAAAQAAVTQAGKTVQNPGRRGGAPAAAARDATHRGRRGAGGTGAAAAGDATDGGRRGAAAPAPLPFDQRDIVNNGADDDGSGSTAVLAIAKAFATGPRPKRSGVFMWHAGEEGGLLKSRYNAD